MTTEAIAVPQEPRLGLLKRYHQLSKGERGLLILWGLVLSQFATPIGSAIYYLATQVSYLVRAAHTSGTLTLVGSNPPADWWNRLPNHVQNLLHQHWGLGASAPSWWVTARHDARHVLIGVLVVLLVGSVTIGLAKVRKHTIHNKLAPVFGWERKEPQVAERKRLGPGRMLASVPLAFLAAAAAATPLILFFARVTPVVDHWGISTGNAWIEGWLGKGSLQLTVIGIVAGFAARKVLASTFSTLQEMAVEKRAARNDAPPRWYPPNYQKRYGELANDGVEAPAYGRVMAALQQLMGLFLSLATPVMLFLLGFGIWLLYFGPAAGAH